MSKITEYTSVNTFDSGDVLLKDGTNGTKIIPVESAASEFLRLGGQTAKNAEIETALTDFGSNLAGLEEEYVATNDYAIGDFFMVENKLYKATEPISEGDTITPDTNCVETDISTEFKVTKEIVDGLSEEIVKKANVDGYYTNLAAGTADQLMASQKVHNSDPYIFRTSGGTSDIGNREELEIVGGSVVWNQLIDLNRLPTDSELYSSTTYTENGVTFTKNSDGSISVVTDANGATAVTHVKIGSSYYFTTPIQNHTHLIRCIGGNLSTAYINYSSTRDVPDEKVFPSLNGSGFNMWIKVDAGSVFTTPIKVYPQVFDLTQMFGSEIADHVYDLEQAEAGAGVAWFRKYFPKDYYEYNAGELMHVSDLQSHDMVGFNLWDEEWEVGTISNTTGQPASSASQIRSKNFISVLPNTKYYGRIGNSGLYAWFYDAEKNWIGADHNLNISNRRFKTPSNAHYMKIATYSATIQTTQYNHDICINLSWSGTRDGEYEPYAKHSYPLDPSLTLRGIPKLTADGDLTYDGDVYKPDGTVERRHGIVDLGTLTWVPNATFDNIFNAQLKVSGARQDVVPKIRWICNKYTSYTSTSIGDNNEQSGISISNDGIKVYAKDVNYDDAATFKAAMSGVYLVYELAEPTTEEAEPYTSPQIVYDWGTEEFVTTSIVPVGHNTSYPANLRDKLQHLPDLPDNDGYYMTQVDGTQMSLIRFRIPQAPAEDGTYVLKATVTDGVPVYTWVDPDAVPETEEPTEP